MAGPAYTEEMKSRKRPIYEPGLTRQQFSERLLRFQKVANISGCLMLEGMFGGLLFGNWLSRHNSSGLAEALALTIFLGSLVAGSIFLLGAPRRLGAICPACRKPLIGTSGEIAVATGRCGKCGKTILDE